MTQKPGVRIAIDGGRLGLSLERLRDGTVMLRYDTLESRQAVLINREEWISIIARLSAYGGTTDVWKEMRALHLGLREGWSIDAEVREDT